MGASSALGILPESKRLASCWGRKEGRRTSAYYCPNRDSGDAFWVRGPRESNRGLGIGHRLMASARCRPLVQVTKWFLGRPLRLSVTMPVCNQCPLLGGRGRTGHAVGSRSTGWTPITTAQGSYHGEGGLLFGASKSPVGRNWSYGLGIDA